MRKQIQFVLLDVAVVNVKGLREPEIVEGWRAAAARGGVTPTEFGNKPETRLRLTCRWDFVSA